MRLPDLGATDGSRDIESAAKTHEQILDAQALARPASDDADRTPDPAAGSMSVEQAAGDVDASLDAARLQARIREARSRMLTQPSLPAVRPACATCGGRGWVVTVVPMPRGSGMTCPGCGGSGAA